MKTHFQQATAKEKAWEDSFNYAEVSSALEDAQQLHKGYEILAELGDLARHVTTHKENLTGLESAEGPWKELSYGSLVWDYNRLSSDLVDTFGNEALGVIGKISYNATMGFAKIVQAIFDSILKMIEWVLTRLGKKSTAYFRKTSVMARKFNDLATKLATAEKQSDVRVEIDVDRLTINGRLPKDGEFSQRLMDLSATTDQILVRGNKGTKEMRKVGVKEVNSMLSSVKGDGLDQSDINKALLNIYDEVEKLAGSWGLEYLSPNMARKDFPGIPEDFKLFAGKHLLGDVRLVLSIPYTPTMDQSGDRDILGQKSSVMLPQYSGVRKINVRTLDGKQLVQVPNSKELSAMMLQCAAIATNVTDSLTSQDDMERYARDVRKLVGKLQATAERSGHVQQGMIMAKAVETCVSITDQVSAGLHEHVTQVLAQMLKMGVYVEKDLGL